MPNPAQRIADVITLPARTAGSTVQSAANGTVRQVLAWTANEVDDWGRDPGFVNRVWSASRLRWTTSVGGLDQLPKRSGALIVVNARRFALAPILAALSIGHTSGRTVRFIGRPDVAPLGPVMQRLGGLLPIEAEIEGVLRAGEIVVLGANHETDNKVTGLVDHRLVGAAVAAKATVLPAAVISVATRRDARVEIGKPIRLPRPRRGPLAELEIADIVQARIDALLDELGGTLTGPFDWLPVDWLSVDRLRGISRVVGL